MNSVFVFLLFGVPITCLFLIITGLVMLFSKKKEERKTGSRLLLTGSMILVLVLLIGFSLCSGAFAGRH